MGLRINNNIAALNSYNNVNRTDKNVSSSLEKLSSGFRINKAADDAAGLVVSEGLRSQIGGLTVASRNAQDGVNVAQSADGALSTVTDILQRMRDLSVQASNSGSQDTAAQTAANKEFQALSSELGRIASTTSFGGQKLLDGNYNGQFQIGSNNTGQDRLSIDLSSTSALFTGTATTVAASAGTAKGSVVANAAGALDYDGANAATFTVTVDGGSPITVTLNATYADADAKLAAINTALGSAATASYDTGGELIFTSATEGATSSIAIGGANAAAVVGTVTATPGAAETTSLTGGITGFTAAGLGIDGSNISTTAGAQAAIDAISNALTGVTTARASIGAVQNRFEYAINNLSVSIENITASESAIRDTDMAAEMTKFTKNQILSQAGTSMLAQANSSTQNILTLLRG